MGTRLRDDFWATPEAVGVLYALHDAGDCQIRSNRRAIHRMMKSEEITEIGLLQVDEVVAERFII